MVVRVWHGRTHTVNADRYTEFLQARAAPDYGSVDGLRKTLFLRRREGEVAHFLLVTVWDSMDAVREFAGSQPDRAKYYAEDDAFLLEKEETAALYEVFFER
jgi:heme-degrading monooxygenase HmoA